MAGAWIISATAESDPHSLGGTLSISGSDTPEHGTSRLRDTERDVSRTRLGMERDANRDVVWRPVVLRTKAPFGAVASPPSYRAGTAIGPCRPWARQATLGRAIVLQGALAGEKLTLGATRVGLSASQVNAVPILPRCLKEPPDPDP